MQKPFTGTLLGILIGLAMAIFLARQGYWPADQLTVFFLPGLLGLIGLLLLSMGRPSRGPGTLALALLLVVPMTLWGALGFANLNETGQLNGGCTVSAQASSDSTTVTDTSRQDPFVIDPSGGLAWQATSPEVFQNFDWQISVYVGGIPIPIDSGTEANGDENQQSEGDVPDVAQYADSRGIDLDLYRGVYKVGGSAATCDGFGFVEVSGDGTDLIAIIALIVAITLLIILLVLTFWKRPDGSTSADSAVDDHDNVVDVTEPTPPADDGTPGPAAGIAAGAMAAGYGSVDNVDELDADDVEEIQEAGASGEDED